MKGNRLRSPKERQGQRSPSAVRVKFSRFDLGYSLPLVVAAALILIAGTAVFANRAGMGLLSSIFQNQSWEAKEAAEIGMTQIVSELNKETNRYLMVKRPGDNNGIWSTSSNPFVAATRTNPCTGATEPSYANLDAQTGTTNAADSAYGTWYSQESDEITRTRGNAVRGFKLTAVTRQEITSMCLFHNPSQRTKQTKTQGSNECEAQLNFV